MATITLVNVLPDNSGIKLLIQMTNQAITAVLVERQDPDGFWRTLGQASRLPLVNGQATINDVEMPYDTPVRYRVSQVVPVGSETGLSADITVDSQGESWLKDPAYPTMSVKIPIVTSIQALTRKSRTGVFAVINRANPIVVSGKRQGAEGELVLYTRTDYERNSVNNVIDRGTVLLLQTPPHYGWGSAYVSIADTVETRVGVASEQLRRFDLPFVVVDRPDEISITPALAKTWQAVKTTYPTWGDLKASGKTWRQLLEEGP